MEQLKLTVELEARVTRGMGEGGGGGGGGLILLAYRLVTTRGTLLVNGGAGGTGYATGATGSVGVVTDILIE